MMSFRAKTPKSLYSLDIPTRESLYAEMKLMHRFDDANVFKYSMVSTFHGSKIILDEQHNDTIKFYNQSIQCVLDHEIKMFVGANSHANKANCNVTTERLPITMDGLRINCDGNVATNVTALLNIAKKTFKVKGMVYRLSVGLERNLQISNLHDNIMQLKLCEANKCVRTHYWYIRCFFNDDTDFIFRVSFDQGIDPAALGATKVKHLLNGTINSKVKFDKCDGGGCGGGRKKTIMRKIIGCGTTDPDPYTMHITCIDPYIEPDQFIVVSDLLLKYYKTQHLTERGKIRPTFMNVQAIRALTSEQKMLLATMELVEFIDV